MQMIHRWFNGSWNLCRHPAMCRSQIHLDNLTLAEARALPENMIEQLLEIIDPPTFLTVGGKNWMDFNGFEHRSYDLPAYIDSEGYREWNRHGRTHRGGDRPARIWPDGSAQWYRDGAMHRDGGKPAYIDAKDNFAEYWEFGKQLRRVRLDSALTR